jgi:hypothetical protein
MNTDLTERELRAIERSEQDKMRRVQVAPIDWTADEGSRVYCAGAEWRYEENTGWFLREGAELERVPPGSSRVPMAVRKHFEEET